MRRACAITVDLAPIETTYQELGLGAPPRGLGGVVAERCVPRLLPLLAQRDARVTFLVQGAVLEGVAGHGHETVERPGTREPRPRSLLMWSAAARRRWLRSSRRLTLLHLELTALDVADMELDGIPKKLADAVPSLGVPVAQKLSVLAETLAALEPWFDFVPLSEGQRRAERTRGKSRRRSLFRGPLLRDLSS